MTDREVYPNAPLVSVAFELRHPRTEPLVNPQRAIIKDLLSETLPLMRVQSVSSQKFEFGPAGPPSSQVTTEEHTKYFDRKMSVVASLTSESTLIETSQYAGWDSFSDLIMQVCNARNEVDQLDGIERIGLRYIDEIRIPGNSNPDWSDYVDSSLLGPHVEGHDGLTLNQWQGVAAYGPTGGRSLVMRHATGDGVAVDPNSELKRKNRSDSGKFFLLDIDSFWIPENGIPEFEISEVESLIELLHEPVREMFESCIKDRLRNEVLRK